MWLSGFPSFRIRSGWCSLENRIFVSSTEKKKRSFEDLTIVNPLIVQVAEELAAALSNGPSFCTQPRTRSPEQSALIHRAAEKSREGNG